MNYLAQHFWSLETNRIDGQKLWDALQPYIQRGELVVNEGKGDREGLKLVTYSKTYQYEHDKIPWDPLVQHCRGIIFDALDTLTPYRIVALPFSKFFNYGEGGIHYPSEGAQIESIYEKVDGSLGIAFYWKGKWQITTRGSLNSDIGVVAQEMLDKLLAKERITLDPRDTRLYEIIYPENRICVNYGDVRELVYLGRRNTSSGEVEYNAPSAVWRTPKKYTFENKDELLSWLNKQDGSAFEGVVVHFSDGSIFKFKSEDYMRLHRIIAQFTFKRVLEAVQLHQEEEIRKALPEELIPEFDRYIEIINSKVKDIVARVALVVASAPKESRKEFALYLQQYYKGTDVLKYAFKFVDLNMDGYKLMEHVLQSLRRDDFEVVENEKES